MRYNVVGLQFHRFRIPSTKVQNNFESSKSEQGIILFQPDNVTPAGGGVLALVVLFHGAGKDVGFASSTWPGVLLGADDDGLGAVELVDTIDKKKNKGLVPVSHELHGPRAILAAKA